MFFAARAGVCWRAHVLLPACFCCTRRAYYARYVLLLWGVLLHAAPVHILLAIAFSTAGTASTTSADPAAVCCNALAFKRLLFRDLSSTPTPRPAPLLKATRMKRRAVVSCRQISSILSEMLEGRTAQFWGCDPCAIELWREGGEPMQPVLVMGNACHDRVTEERQCVIVRLMFTVFVVYRSPQTAASAQA